MNTQNGDEVDLTTTNEENVDLDTTNTDESSEDAEFDWKAEAEKQKQIAENQKIRAEKAEEKVKKPEVKTVNTRKEEDLSTLDIIALSKASIDTEDMPEVIRWAKYNNIPVTEALKSPELKAVLGVRQEMRSTANATYTGSAKRSSGRVSDETLVAQASKGNIPDSDEELERLVKAKMFAGRKK